MLLLGLTGSIATGKSSVSALLASPPHSLPLIDADLLARRVVAPGTKPYAQIVRYFGESTPELLLPAPAPREDDDGEGERIKGGKKKEEEGRPLNRAALGRRVFGDSVEKRRDRAVLDRIVHPAVRWEMWKAVGYYYVRGYWAVVLDVPLLFESGLDVVCGAVVVVGVREREVQIRRLLERDRMQGGGMTREEAEGRVGSQWGVGEKVGRCQERNRGLWLWGRREEEEEEVGRGWVIWNDGPKEELAAKVDEVVEKVRRSSPEWWAWVCLLVPMVGAAAGLWQVFRNLLDKWAWERRQRAVKAKL